MRTCVCASSSSSSCSASVVRRRPSVDRSVREQVRECCRPLRAHALTRAHTHAQAANNSISAARARPRGADVSLCLSPHGLHVSRLAGAEARRAEIVCVRVCAGVLASVDDFIMERSLFPIALLLLLLSLVLLLLLVSPLLSESAIVAPRIHHRMPRVRRRRASRQCILTHTGSRPNVDRQCSSCKSFGRPVWAPIEPTASRSITPLHPPAQQQN